MKTRVCVLGRLISYLTLVAWLMLGAATAQAAKTWMTTTGTNDWFDGTNWSGSTYPVAGDDVVITNAGVGVLLTNATAALSSVILSNTATLIFSNWDTALSATNVTIATGAVVTCAGPFTNNVMSNRVHIVCSNLAVNAGGRVLVDSIGFAGGIGGSVLAKGNGPGGGGGASGGNGACGGGYGGYGAGTGYVPGWPYGSTNAPLDPGSGGGGSQGAGGNGGGAIHIQAFGSVTVDGLISANGGNNGGLNGGGGSGGSIYVSCITINGCGILSANGGPAVLNGGGGRIAVIYNTVAQTTMPPLSFSTRPGGGGADVGTIFFPDIRFLSSYITNISGQIVAPGFTNWSVDYLTLSNVWIRFPADGFNINVSNDVRVIGPAGRLDVGGSFLNTNFALLTGSTSPAVLQVGGNLVLTNSSCLYVYNAQTNASTVNYGSLVNVSRSLLVNTGCWIYAQSHPTNGGSALFRVNDMYIASNACISSAGRGYAGGYGPGYSTAGGGRPGGSYGGLGGRESGNTYGSSNAPIDAGSGGGWVFGGGVVRIVANKSLLLNGIINANGANANAGGGGAGGSIYLSCRRLSGTNGSILANGGNAWNAGYSEGGGGGGRIAVWRVSDDSWINSVSVTGGVSYSGTSTPGTVVWGWIPPPGTVFVIH